MFQLKFHFGPDGKLISPQHLRIPPLDNPVVPLKFEKFNQHENEVGDEETIEEIKALGKENVPFVDIIDKEFSLIQRSSALDKFVFPRMKTAHILAIKAYREKDPAATARDILKTKGDIPEAYNILALFSAKTYEKALFFYKEAVKCAPDMLSGSRFKEICQLGQCGEFAYTRPYVRALHGLANTYRKMERYTEAEDIYKQLAKCASDCNMNGDFTWRYHYLEVLLKQKKDDEAWDLAHSEEMRSSFQLTATQVCWYWTLALLHFRRGVQTGFEIEYTIGTGDLIEAPLLTAVGYNQEVLAFLRGQRKLPAVEMPYVYSKKEDGLVAAAIYASSHKTLWDETPGAIEWAVKNANTFKCIGLISGSPQCIQRFNLNMDYFSLKEIVDDGVYLDAVVQPNGLRVLHEAVMRCPRNLLCLLEAGADPNAISAEPRLKHYSILYAVMVNDGSPLCIKYLLEFGADPLFVWCPEDDSVSEFDRAEGSESKEPQSDGGFGPEEQHSDDGSDSKEPQSDSDQTRDYPKVTFNRSPLEEALVFGHAVMVYAAIKFSKDLPTDKFENFLGILFTSSDYDCVTSGIKCQQCKNNPINQHSKYTNFEACITALLSTGFRPSSEYLESLKKIKPKRRKSLMKYLENQMKKSTEKLRESIDAMYLELFASCSRCSASCYLKRCSGCRDVRYCSEDCQKEYWERHKTKCRIDTQGTLVSDSESDSEGWESCSDESDEEDQSAGKDTSLGRKTD